MEKRDLMLNTNGWVKSNWFSILLELHFHLIKWNADSWPSSKVLEICPHRRFARKIILPQLFRWYSKAIIDETVSKSLKLPITRRRFSVNINRRQFKRLSQSSRELWVRKSGSCGAQWNGGDLQWQNYHGII